MTDWLPELGDDDLATLMEALEAWESKGDLGDFMLDMLAGETSKINAGELKLKRQREAVVRKERSVLLRAKLLTLRDRRRVEHTVTK